MEDHRLHRHYRPVDPENFRFLAAIATAATTTTSCFMRYVGPERHCELNGGTPDHVHPLRLSALGGILPPVRTAGRERAMATNASNSTDSAAVPSAPQPPAGVCTN